ncbi:MAG: chemotaxis family two-component system response regulator Rcp1 [Porticoccaceae bacterium]|jgi:chemotaxis family two-component system response regulator Rcp1
MNDRARPMEILLVEDSPTDADLAMRALQQGKLDNSVHHVRDGVEAMEFLRHEGDYASVPRPDLILLDLNMPRMDGREVLKAVRSDGNLKTIPVVVLTTSDDEPDVLAAYGLCSNAYIVKPVDVEQFFAIVKEIDQFWLRVVRLPDNH